MDHRLLLPHSLLGNCCALGVGAVRLEAVHLGHISTWATAAAGSNFAGGYPQTLLTTSIVPTDNLQPTLEKLPSL